MATDVSGGRVYFSLNGRRYSPRAAVKLKPVSYSRDKGLNYDGTLYTTVKPEPVEADITFSDRVDFNVQELAAFARVDVTIELIDVGVTWLMPAASVVGRPEINTESGEITGLMLVSSSARKVAVAS